MKIWVGLLLLLFCFLFISAADTLVDTNEISEAIIYLHTQKGPGKEHVIWRECGRKLTKKKIISRAAEYAEYISKSILDIRARYAEDINPDHVVAIIYRESSFDECAVGRKEVQKIFGRGKTVTESTLKEWARTNRLAHKACREEGKKSADIGCLDEYMMKKNPLFRGIYAWDIGAAQFRWPGAQTKRRSLVMPAGGKKIEKVSLRDLLKAEVSIQMLVEDLAVYKKKCRSHRHYHKRRGRRIKLKTEEAYFVHHHAGELGWSEKYRKRVNRHLVQILKNRFEIKVRVASFHP